MDASIASHNEESAVQCESLSLSVDNSTTSNQESVNQSPANSIRMKKRPAVYSNQPTNKRVLELVAKRLEAGEGHYDAFGKYVAQELTNMSPEMVPFVKKIINDAIFEGHMKVLNRTSRISTAELVAPHIITIAQPQNSNAKTQEEECNLTDFFSEYTAE